jgi:hypothetical protein
LAAFINLHDFCFALDSLPHLLPLGIFCIVRSVFRARIAQALVSFQLLSPSNFSLPPSLCQSGMFQLPALFCSTSSPVGNFFIQRTVPVRRFPLPLGCSWFCVCYRFSVSAGGQQFFRCRFLSTARLILFPRKDSFCARLGPCQSFDSTDCTHSFSAGFLFDFLWSRSISLWFLSCCRLTVTYAVCQTSYTQHQLECCRAHSGHRPEFVFPVSIFVPVRAMNLSGVCSSLLRVARINLIFWFLLLPGCGSSVLVHTATLILSPK